MNQTFFSSARRMIALAGIGLLAANCLMADLAPSPTRRRPQPIPMKADPASQQPVRPYIQHMDPSQQKQAEPIIVTMYGRLIYLAQNATPDANYALCRRVEERLVPVCFLKWDGGGLEQFINQEVKATGFLKEMRGWTCPLLIFEYLENIEFLQPGEETSKPLPPPVFTPVEAKPVQPLPPPQPVKPLPPPPAAKSLPPPQPARPLPPPPEASPLPPPAREDVWIMSPSNEYRPIAPKAADPLRLYR